MKSILIGIILTLFLTQICFAQPLSPITGQGGWFCQNPSQAGQRIHDMQFIDSLTGYACGYGGLFLITTDGGNHWIEKQAPEEELIVDLYFLDRDFGWILYYLPNRLYRTTDGGNSWNFISELLSRDPSFVYFLDEQNGFAGGITGPIRYLLKTNDGGFTWTDETEVND
ncbi:MAG TPA: YCF48-related protein, partial [Ignavibacteriaceae bacterium]